MSRLPTFFIVGAPKAGTTSLYHYLDQHPQIYMSAIKEPNYFAPEIRPEFCQPDLRRAIESDAPQLREFLAGPRLKKRFGGIVDNWDDYLRLFANAGDDVAAIGEASVCYLWSPCAPAKIAERIPGAKIVIMLRDPADRAFSQYLHGLSNGNIDWTFHEHIQRARNHTSGQICLYHPFLEFGLYAQQVERYKNQFGSNVWVASYEDFKQRPSDVYRNLCRFLGVDTDFSPSFERRHLQAQVPRLSLIGWTKRAGLWEAAAKLTPKAVRPLARHLLTRKHGTVRMEVSDREFLNEFYREDSIRLSALHLATTAGPDNRQLTTDN